MNKSNNFPAFNSLENDRDMVHISTDRMHCFNCRSSALYLKQKDTFEVRITCLKQSMTI